MRDYKSGGVKISSLFS